MSWNENVSYLWAKIPLLYFQMHFLKYVLLISDLMQFPGLRGSLFQHIASILYIVMYYLNAFIIKWDMHKLCRLPKRLPSGQISLSTASLMLPSSFPLAFTELPGTRRYYSNMERLFKQKWETQRWAFIFTALRFCDVINQDRGSGENKEPYPQSYWLSLEMRVL